MGFSHRLSADCQSITPSAAYSPATLPLEALTVCYSLSFLILRSMPRQLSMTQHPSRGLRSVKARDGEPRPRFHKGRRRHVPPGKV